MDKVQFILSTIPKMAEFTFPFITSVIGVVDARSGQHIGSGLRCFLGGRRAIVTARHVIETALSFPNGFAISAGYGRDPYLTHGQLRLDHAGDLAIYYVPDDYSNDDSAVRFLPEDRIQKTRERLSTDYLFTHGFPGVRSRFFSMVQGVASKSLPYGAMQRLENLPADMESFQFAIDFDPRNMKPLSVGDDSFIAPHGLSGSPVWRIGISGRTRSEWRPELSSVVGFITQWRPDERVLIATSAERL